MGLCISREERELRNRSAAIDRVIEEDAKKMRKECKILLLGSGESGKSTIFKQIKIMYQGGYSKHEFEERRSAVYKNVGESITALIREMKRLNESFADPENAELARRIEKWYDVNDLSTTITPDLADMIARVWSDKNVGPFMDRTSEFYIMDSAPYFFDNVKRIGANDYLPNEQDVLRARTKTTGIIPTNFSLGQLDVHIFDVGGQRSERRKWIHCFEAVTSIIFCVALNEYDQVLLEENSQNRMAESLILFESVLNSRWFLRTSIILFLNKIDLFKIRLTKVPLEKYFPEYTGGPDLNKAAKFILWRFTQANRARLNIYPHLTQATDTSNIRLVFAAIKVTILQNALKDSGIM